MDQKISYQSLIRKLLIQLIAAGICTAVLFLFVALTYSQLTLPTYIAAYNQKDTQQVVNLIITICATVIGILLSHCRRLTNEAETKVKLRNNELTIPRLDVHFHASGGSKEAMGLSALHNRQVWSLAAFYFFAMVIFGFLNSVLSVIFVVDAVISGSGVEESVHIPLSVDIPTYSPNPCSTHLSEPGCAYELALTALSSELVTYTPYTIGGVTFQPTNGTMGLPFYAMRHFSESVSGSQFDEEYHQYCLPVLEPRIISCHEVPFNLVQNETYSKLVRFKALEISETNFRGQNDTDPRIVPLAQNALQSFKVVVDYPSNHPGNIKYRNNDQGQGTMVVLDLDYGNTSIIAASDDGDFGGYASLLYEMTYGHPRDLTSTPYYFFVSECEMQPIHSTGDGLSSWRQVAFTFKDGISQVNVTDVPCQNPRGSETSGFSNIYYMLQAAAEVLSSTDGYSKLLNLNSQSDFDSSIFKDMSRLDAAVNKIYHLVQTAWTQSMHQYAMQSKAVYEKPIIMTRFPHLYVIRISWTTATYIGLVLSILIVLNAWAMAVRWAIATYKFGAGDETWNLLRPVDLIAYSLAAYEDLIYDLDSVEHRQKAMRGKTEIILRERSVLQGTQSLIALVSNSEKSPASSIARVRMK